MHFSVTTKLRLHIPSDTDMELMEQEAFRIADEMGLEVEWFHGTAASEPYIEAESNSEKELMKFVHRLGDFYYLD